MFCLIIQAEERPELYCKACNQHFSSEHNKKEHMLGRQHLQMIAEEFEKESQTTLKTKSGTPGQPENLEKSPSVHEDETEMSEATKMTTLSDVMETLLQHNYGNFNWIQFVLFFFFQLNPHFRATFLLQKKNKKAISNKRKRDQQESKMIE